MLNGCEALLKVVKHKTCNSSVGLPLATVDLLSMNEKYIRLLIAISSIAVLGLIAIQVYWVRNSFTLKEQQFSINVNKALLDVVRLIEEKEMMDIIGQRKCHCNRPWRWGSKYQFAYRRKKY
jgi:hypothetical protein